MITYNLFPNAAHMFTRNLAQTGDTQAGDHNVPLSARNFPPSFWDSNWVSTQPSFVKYFLKSKIFSGGPPLPAPQWRAVPRGPLEQWGPLAQLHGRPDGRHGGLLLRSPDVPLSQVSSRLSLVQVHRDTALSLAEIMTLLCQLS